MSNKGVARRILADLMAAGHVTEPTSRVLEQRIEESFNRSFFAESEFARLQAVARRMVPHDPNLMDLAGAVDDRLARGLSDGWRYDDSPPDREAYRRLLAALPDGFEQLSEAAQDAQLRTLQRTHARPFEDLLAELAGYYYSHPLVQIELGILGFADAPRWNRLGLNELDERERRVWQVLGLAEER